MARGNCNKRGKHFNCLTSALTESDFSINTTTFHSILSHWPRFLSKMVDPLSRKKIGTWILVEEAILCSKAMLLYFWIAVAAMTLPPLFGMLFLWKSYCFPHGILHFLWAAWLHLLSRAHGDRKRTIEAASLGRCSLKQLTPEGQSSRKIVTK